jgi:predicted transcriptional regulator
MTLAAKPVLTEVSRATERHYSVAEIAEMWKLSPSAVRKFFQNESGVLAIGEPRPKYGRRRGKVTLRIPQSVLERVYRRLCIAANRGLLSDKL